LEITFRGEPIIKGTYSTNGNSFTLTVTHISGDYDLVREYNVVSGKWYSRADSRALGVSEYELDNCFSPETTRYSISGNTFCLDEIYYRR